jgi:hypothetical protein
MLVIVLGSVLGKHREEDPKGWSTVLDTALGSVLGKLVPHDHYLYVICVIFI